MPESEPNDENKNSFKRLNKITDIYIFGLSCDSVDLPYLKEINCVCEEANWHVYEYGQTEKLSERMEKQLTNAGIFLKQCHFWNAWSV